eukprot:TRINITY_DN20566_c0_g1_i6.p1 TRINITY_DN20566_c0_g1~~TRINITY_DN20566_c0_g1_i6.p1  ORF type:complete len:361 (+),score=56.50 TRINITY_DN20566_c0_g1_i6:420-1502(+)
MERSGSSESLLFQLDADLPEPVVNEEKAPADVPGDGEEVISRDSTQETLRSSLSSGLSFLNQAQHDTADAMQQGEARSGCRMCGREVPVARLIAHSKVCKISSRYQKVISKCDDELRGLESRLAHGQSFKQLGTLCAVARSILPLEPGALHRCKRLRQRLGELRKKTGNLDELEPILHAVEEKMRSIKGMDNLAWRQQVATPGADGDVEVIASPSGQHRADALEKSHTTKWIYQTLCRSSYFEHGVPESERRHIGSTRRVKYMRQKYRLVRESCAEIMDHSRNTILRPQKPFPFSAHSEDTSSWAQVQSGFRVAGELGSGSIGLIYRVIREADGEQMALKLFKIGCDMKRALKELSLIHI